MITVIKRSFPTLAAGSVLAGSLLVAAPAFAAGPTTHPFTRPAVMGQVTAVSGNTLTVTRAPFRHDTDNARTNNAAATTTYTVNAASATVTKDGKTSSVSAITVGDHIMVTGTVSGTTVTATTIRDGSMGGWRGMRGHWGDHGNATTTQTPPIQGNGEPIIGGTVSAISSTTLTVATKAGITYTVNAASAKIVKAGVTNPTTTSITVGDSVVVQGTVEGTSVTASSVLDHSAPKATAKHPNFFGMIGGFFTRIFGFF